MRNVLIICLGFLTNATVMLNIASRSVQLEVLAFGMILGLGGLIFLIRRIIMSGFTIITVLEMALFATAVVLGAINLAQIVKY